MYGTVFNYLGYGLMAQQGKYLMRVFQNIYLNYITTKKKQTPDED